MKNRVLATALIFLTAVFVTGAFLAPAALADWDKDDPHKMHFPQMPDEDGWEINATYPNVLADDWRCSESGPIRAIHFWGSWKDDKPGTITSFHLSIHEDIPADPSNNILYSRPGALLEEYDIPISEVTVSGRIMPANPDDWQGWYDPNTEEIYNPNHQIYYQYNVVLPSDKLVDQKEGTIYWLDISAHVKEAPELLWGWKTADLEQYPEGDKGQHFMDDAVWSIDENATYPDGVVWTHLTDPKQPHPSLDLAFVIDPLPELPTIALFCVGLVGIGGYFGLRKARQGKRELS